MKSHTPGFPMVRVYIFIERQLMIFKRLIKFACFSLKFMFRVLNKITLLVSSIEHAKQKVFMPGSRISRKGVQSYKEGFDL